MAHNYRTWIEISSTALRHNLASVQRLIGPGVGIMPIVKSNAYGHGLREVMTILQGQRHWGLGVAYGQEALDLRAMKHRGRVVVLSSWQKTELAELVKRKIELVVWDFVSLQAVIDIARRLHLRPKIHLKLDTGTTRVGFLVTDMPKLKRQLIIHQHRIQVVGVFSHFANAEERSSSRTIQQEKYFTTLESRLPLNGRVERHIACTAAILRYPEARFGLVRLGIGLYGLWPSDEIRAWSGAKIPTMNFQPVIQWKTGIAQLKRVPTGTAVGYSGTWVARRPSIIGTVPVGYGDGYHRSWSNKSWVMIRGHRAPIVGRISMNLLMIDVTRVPNVRLTDVVTLLGPGITADDLAHLGEPSINYEVVTTIHPNVPRLIV